MKKISEVIGGLAQMLAAHGDLGCVVSDGSGTCYDDLGKLRIETIHPYVRSVGDEAGQHDKAIPGNTDLTRLNVVVFDF